uniref:Uncharacterized protein n=1 Tax=Physcomitrium patens TaxID=3218 RepID=A0A2K1IXL0_PHYPA|nr:hypothetical protein PHYPA_023835 [Physcomitrium patens]
MASLGANTSLGNLCTTQSTNLTSGLCPITKVSQLEEMINTTKLLDACHSVDPLKECTEEPIFQSRVMDIAIQMAGQLMDDTDQLNGSAVPRVDCKNMVLAWLASKLGPDAANTMLRNLINYRINKGSSFQHAIGSRIFFCAIHLAMMSRSSTNLNLRKSKM